MSCPDTTLVTDNIRAHQVPMDPPGGPLELQEEHGGAYLLGWGALKFQAGLGDCLIQGV